MPSMSSPPRTFEESHAVRSLRDAPPITPVSSNAPLAQLPPAVDCPYYLQRHTGRYGTWSTIRSVQSGLLPMRIATQWTVFVDYCATT